MILPFFNPPLSTLWFPPCPCFAETLKQAPAFCGHPFLARVCSQIRRSLCGSDRFRETPGFRISCCKRLQFRRVLPFRQFAGPFRHSNGFRPIAIIRIGRSGQHPRKTVERFWKIRPSEQRTGVLTPRLADIPKMSHSGGEFEMCDGVSRSADSFAEKRSGLYPLRLLAKLPGQVVLGLAVLRVEAESLPKLSRAVCRPAFLQVDYPKIVVRLSQVRIQLHGLRVMFHSLVQATLSMEHSCQIVFRAGRFRIQGQRCSVMSSRLLQLALFSQRKAERDMHLVPDLPQPKRFFVFGHSDI